MRAGGSDLVARSRGLHAGEAFVYWANSGTGTIGRANLDGCRRPEVHHRRAIPRVGGTRRFHIYWDNVGGNTIGRANLDGSGVDEVHHRRARAVGVAVDSAHLFWANNLDDSIGRANLDGSGVDQIFISAKDPCGPAVNATHLYWGTGLGDTIGRASLSGTGVDRKFISGTTFAAPWRLTPRPLLGGTVDDRRAKLNGTGVERSSSAAKPRTTVETLDAADVYWANGIGAMIGRAHLNGKGAIQSFICGANLPGGVAVDALAPPPPPSPSNQISFCEVNTNTHKGTAKVTLNVDAPRA